MKFIKRLLKWSIITFITSIILLYVFDYNYFLKAAYIVYYTGHRTVFIDDHQYFENDTIQKGEDISPWPIHKNYNKVKATEKLSRANKKWKTVAYLIIKNDSILFEKYYQGYNEYSKINSFSMTKSIVSAMLGKAIMDGYIKNLDQPISDFYPEYSYAKTTVGDLSSMASGLDWDESYSYFSSNTKAYFDDNIAETVLDKKIIKTHGKEFDYLSVNAQLLGMIIKKATGKSLSNYLSESLWQPMGASDDALWQLDDDENKLAKSFCCLSSNARNFARFGKLYKNHGKWDNKQVLDSAFVAKSLKPRFKDFPYYGYGWWIEHIEDKHFFYMRGFLGQYVIFEPNDNLIIVRLGQDMGTTKSLSDIDIFVEETYKMLDK